jgi:hypothetical protein
VPLARYRVTLEPPEGDKQPARSFETLPLEPGEIWSVMLVAFRMLTTDQWAVRFERLPDETTG